MKLGEFEISVVSDGTFAVDGGAMFGVVPRVLWERHFTPDPLNRVRIGLNCLLVRTGRENILIDTGIGSKWDERGRKRYGIAHETDLVSELARFGLQPADVDFVINTHLHFDHAGTNTIETEGRLRPAFPRARYVVQRGEMEHASSPHERDRASYDSRDFEPVAEAGLFEFIDGDAEIVPGIRVEKVAGHNRDLQCVRIDSEGRTAYCFADLLPTTAHLPAAWVMGFDLYPVDTLQQKKRIIPQAAKEGWVCVFYHDPGVPLAKLRGRDDGFVAEPVG